MKYQYLRTRSWLFNWTSLNCILFSYTYEFECFLALLVLDKFQLILQRKFFVHNFSLLFRMHILIIFNKG